MYAILCHTNVISKKEGCPSQDKSFSFIDYVEERIVDEIGRQFPLSNLQYVCVSTDSQQSPSTMYIQIILKKVVNKMGWFLDRITGMYT